MTHSQLEIIIPVFNEELEVVQGTIAQIWKVFRGTSGIGITVVNDGSDEKYRVSELKDDTSITYLEHQRNSGYGSALKTGISASRAPWIAITDADGTYPVEELPPMLELMKSSDMVIGVRTGKISQIPLLRRFPKKILNMFASYMAGTKIVDLNSGLRIFTRELCYAYWPFYPKGFSFTSTITMGAIIGGYRVTERPINYFKREGSSSISPIKDTVRFFRLIGRLGLIFYPMKLFGPVALLLLFLGATKGTLDYTVSGGFGNFSILTLLASIQIFMMGLVAKLIVFSRTVSALQTKFSSDLPQISEQSQAKKRSIGS